MSASGDFVQAVVCTVWAQNRSRLPAWPHLALCRGWNAILGQTIRWDAQVRAIPQLAPSCSVQGVQSKINRPLSCLSMVAAFQCGLCHLSEPRGLQNNLA